MAPFGETVLAWRLVRKLTQVQLSTLAGVSRPNLSAIERGDREVTLVTLRRLALALGIRPGLLADGTLPGQREARDPSRLSLERIAAAALTDTNRLPQPDGELARRLRDVTSTRFARGGRTTGATSNRKAARSLLLLRGLAGPETVTSLLDRMRDHEARDPRRAANASRRPARRPAAGDLP